MWFLPKSRLLFLSTVIFGMVIDFRHGSIKFQTFGKRKYQKNRERDLKNHSQLLRMGWTVIRLWEHEIEKDFEDYIRKIISSVYNRQTEQNDTVRFSSQNRQK